MIHVDVPSLLKFLKMFIGFLLIYEKYYFSCFRQESLVKWFWWKPLMELPVFSSHEEGME